MYEDLTSYYRIVLIITLYPDNIHVTHLTIDPPSFEERERKKERNIYTTLVHYHWNKGRSVLCTRVHLFVTLFLYLPS